MGIKAFDLEALLNTSLVGDFDHDLADRPPELDR